MILLGLFTVGIDFVLALCVKIIMSA
jgi:hypothetical protein